MLEARYLIMEPCWAVSSRERTFASEGQSWAGRPGAIIPPVRSLRPRVPTIARHHDAYYEMLLETIAGLQLGFRSKGKSCCAGYGNHMAIFGRKGFRGGCRGPTIPGKAIPVAPTRDSLSVLALTGSPITEPELRERETPSCHVHGRLF
jgi:hypothetical protein